MNQCRSIRPARKTDAVRGVRSLRTAILLSIAALLTPAALAATRERVTLVEVYDADTVAVERPDGTRKTIRLIGVDAPEIQGKYRDVELGGDAAAAFAEELMALGPVVLHADPDGDDEDKYGRQLRYVHLPDGRDAGAEIIASGYARAYRRFGHGRRGTYIALEEEAKTAKRGLWGTCRPEG